MYWPYLCRLSAFSRCLSAGFTTGARRGPAANQTCQHIPIKTKVYEGVRGRCAVRMLGTSGSAGESFSAYCRGVVVKARTPRETARERPEPSRIRERAEAIVRDRIAAIEQRQRNKRSWELDWQPERESGVESWRRRSRGCRMNNAAFIGGQQTNHANDANHTNSGPELRFFFFASNSPLSASPSLFPTSSSTLFYTPASFLSSFTFSPPTLFLSGFFISFSVVFPVLALWTWWSFKSFTVFIHIWQPCRAVYKSTLSSMMMMSSGMLLDSSLGVL